MRRTTLEELNASEQEMIKELRDRCDQICYEGFCNFLPCPNGLYGVGRCDKANPEGSPEEDTLP